MIDDSVPNVPLNILPSLPFLHPHSIHYIPNRHTNTQNTLYHPTIQTQTHALICISYEYGTICTTPLIKYTSRTTKGTSQEHLATPRHEHGVEWHFSARINYPGYLEEYTPCRTRCTGIIISLNLEKRRRKEYRTAKLSI